METIQWKQVKSYEDIKHESFADSRQVVGARDDQSLLYPEKKNYDSFCQDINANGQFEMVAIQTRLHIDADGTADVRNELFYDATEVRRSGFSCIDCVDNCQHK